MLNFSARNNWLVGLARMIYMTLIFIAVVTTGINARIVVQSEKNHHYHGTTTHINHMEERLVTSSNERSNSLASHHTQDHHGHQIITFPVIAGLINLSAHCYRAIIRTKEEFNELMKHYQQLQQEELKILREVSEILGPKCIFDSPEEKASGYNI